MAQGGTLAASPEEDRDVGGLSYTCCKQVSPATTWRLLPGRESPVSYLMLKYYSIPLDRPCQWFVLQRGRRDVLNRGRGASQERCNEESEGH